ncbi:hypothetical protein HXX01_00550 [Candidatus Nomurabacteria bacterium]|nr:hypothetical protein [Candidatus Nomurabacteria bacterium]
MKNTLYILFIITCTILCRTSLPAQNSFTYRYDASDKIIHIETSEGNLTDYQYDELGNRIGMTINHLKTFTIRIIPEGLYNPLTQHLNKAQNGSGNEFGENIADSIQVEIHQNTFPFSKIGNSFATTLNTNGNIELSIPSSYSGSYYVVVKHRNSIETWSAIPISLVGLAVSYDFTTSGAQAFGSNLKNINGKYCMYGGDVNQDGIVDGSDMAQVDNASTAILHGYINTDVNGDGVVDATDMAMVDNNSTGIVHVHKP